MSTFRFPSAKKMRKLMKMVHIIDQKTAVRRPFIPNAEQEIILDAVAGKSAPKVQTLKSRQIGSSTIFCFLDAVFLVMNPGCEIGIIADEEVKAQGLLDRTKSFVHQMGIATPAYGRRRIVLSNGSQARAITASAKKGQDNVKTGRSFSFQLIHMSELAFWPDQDVFGALEASAGLAAPIWNESTSSGPGDLFWHQWHNHKDFQKLFFPMSMHDAYRSNRELDRIEKVEAEKLGYDNEQAAAFFFDKMYGSFRGDMISALREYPEKPEHAFLSAEGRWVRHAPNVIPTVDIRDGVQFFRHPEEVVGGVVMAVDTSEGKEQDGSTIVVLERSSGTLVASYKSDSDEVDDLAERVRFVYSQFETDQLQPTGLTERVSTVDGLVIEDNSIGHATVQKVRRFGLPVKAVRTDKPLQWVYMLEARRAIERGQIYGPQELLEECESCRLNARGKFEGKKDLIMSVGMALEEMRFNPYVAPAEPERKDTLKLKRYLGNGAKKWSTF